VPIVIITCIGRRLVLTIDQLGNNEAANVEAERLPTLANVHWQFWKRVQSIVDTSGPADARSFVSQAAWRRNLFNGPRLTAARVNDRLCGGQLVIAPSLAFACSRLGHAALSPS
jgi:hypothetical protein